jgi:hypothetical protein
MPGIKYFAEALLITLILSVSLFLYSLVQIIFEAIRLGWLDSMVSPFIMGFLLAAGIFSYASWVFFFKAVWMPVPQSPFNTAMNAMLEMYR